ncbi:MAG: hypothetical protein ACOCUL_04300 [Bacteroidota bacterium]
MKYNIPNYVSLRSWHPWTNEPKAEFTSRDLSLLKQFYPGLKGIGGHTTRQYLDYEKAFSNKRNRNIKYFTFVREPISRYLSHFQYQIDIKGNEWTIESFSNEGRFNNFMVKRLAGCENLEKAILNLKKFDFIGLQEKFNQSLILLNQIIFNNSFDIRYESKNVSSSKSKLNFETLNKSLQDRIINNNKLDLALYDYIISEIYSTYIRQCPNIKNKELLLENALKDYHYNPLKFNIIRLWKAYNVYFAEPLIRKLR